MLRYADFKATNLSPFRCTATPAFFGGKVMGRYHTMVNTATLATALVLLPHVSSAQSSISLNPSTLPRIGKADEGFQSYNVEMLEVTGGRFWKPYGSAN